MARNRVLIIASQPESREPALVIAEELKANGYSPVFCNTGGDLSDIIDDRPIGSNMPLSDISGIVVVDDGGDEKSTLSVIRRANKDGLALGGFGLGCLLMRKANAFKNQYVCSGFDESFYKGMKQVASPATRSGNIVSCSSPACVHGFGVLMVGALGGKAKNMVTSEEAGKYSLVVSSNDNWPSYWDLAKDLHSKNIKLVVAESKDLDFKEKKAKYALLLDVEKNSVRPVTTSIPKSFWLQETEDRVKTAKALEGIGCVGLHSVESEELMADHLRVYKILSIAFLNEVTPVKVEDVSKLAKAGTSHWLISGKGKKKVSGRGNFVMMASGKEAQIVSLEELSQIISEHKNEGGLLQECLSSDDFGSLSASFSLLVKDSSDDCKIVHAFSKVSGGTFEYWPVIQTLLNDKADKFHQEASEIAKTAYVTLKASINNPNSLGLIEFEFESVLGSPVLRSASCKYVLGQEKPAQALEKHVGIPIPEKTVQPNSADFGVGKTDKRLHKKILEREMAHNGIYIQPDGSVYMNFYDGQKTTSLEKAIQTIQRKAAKAIEDVIRKERSGSASEKQRASTIAGTLRHKMRLLLAYYEVKNSGQQKLAEYSYDDSIPGPYSNIDLPMNERVMKWEEGDDWLADKDKYIRSQPRYNPEYYPAGDANETFGFYYIWEEPRRSPYYWSRILTEGIYPSTPGMRK